MSADGRASESPHPTDKNKTAETNIRACHIVCNLLRGGTGARYGLYHRASGFISRKHYEPGGTFSST